MSKQTVSASGAVYLGAAPAGRVSTLTLQGDDGASAFVGNVVLKARSVGDALTYAPIPYKQRSLNNAVSDDASAVAAITDQPFIIEADISGLEVELVVTYTSGELKLAWTIAEGK